MNENTSTTQTPAVSIPDILTANTYFWRPSTHADGRRRNETRHNGEVARFIQANQAALAAAGIVIDFSYSESCNHVYKTCQITRNGKRSNITAVYKALGL